MAITEFNVIENSAYDITMYHDTKENTTEFNVSDTSYCII